MYMAIFLMAAVTCCMGVILWHSVALTDEATSSATMPLPNTTAPKPKSWRWSRSCWSGRCGHEQR